MNGAPDKQRAESIHFETRRTFSEIVLWSAGDDKDLAVFWTDGPDLIQLQHSYREEQRVHIRGRLVISQHIGQPPSSPEHSDIQRHCKTFFFREDQLTDRVE
jgi:hypothetical protein